MTKRLYLFISAYVLLLSSAFAQVVPGGAPSAPNPPTSQITGSITTATGGLVSNGTLSFTLSQPALVSGTSTIAASAVSCYTSTAGSIVGVPDPLALPNTSVNLASGTLPAGTYFVELVYVGTGGTKTVPSPEVQVVLSSQGTLNVNPPAIQPASATGFFAVYIGTTSGAETLQGTATSWTQFQQSTPLVAGAALPTTNGTTCNIWFSDSMIPSGTYYTVSLVNKNGSTIAGFPQTWCTFGGANGIINVSQGAPTGNCSTNGVFYPTPIFANPLGNAQQSISGPLNLTGGGSLSGGFNVTAYAFDNIQIVDGVKNATIQAAINALPSTGGRVYVPAGTYTVAMSSGGGIALSKPVRIECEDPKTTTINFTGVSGIAILLNYDSSGNGGGSYLDWGNGVQNCSIIGPGTINGSASNAGTGIQIGDATHSPIGAMFVNDTIAGFAVGSTWVNGTGNSWGVKYDHCIWLNNTQEVVAPNSGTMAIADFIHPVFDTFNSALSNMRVNAVQIQMGGDFNFIDAYFQSDQLAVSNGRVKCTNCTFENPTGQATTTYINHTGGALEMDSPHFLQDFPGATVPTAWITTSSGHLSIRNVGGNNASATAFPFIALSGTVNVDIFGTRGFSNISALFSGSTSGWINAPNPATGRSQFNGVDTVDLTSAQSLSGKTFTGITAFPGNTVALTSDWTCGTGGTVASCTSATIIGSGGGVPLTFTLPLVAQSYTLTCDGVVGQATAATANQWNLLTATNGATNVTANYTMATAATAYAAGAVTDQTSTTTTFQIAPSWTLGGTGTKMPFHIWAKIEGASASGTVVSFQLVAPTVGDLVTIYRGTACTVF